MEDATEKNQGEPLVELSSHDIQVDPSQTPDIAGITDVRYVASYNWAGDEYKRKILVPGSPAAWSPPKSIKYIGQDDGDYYRDINAAGWPDYPLEPAARAVLTVQPGFQTEGVDVVACSSTMRNLLNFVSNEPCQFKMHMQAVGHSLFIIRREKSPRELIPNSGYGRGHNFLERYTSWGKGLHHSRSHQRIISYDLAGLKCLVRFECDAYYADRDSGETGAFRTDPAASISAHVEQDRADSANIVSGSEAPVPDLHISIAGRPPSQSSLIEIKTRSKSGGDFKLRHILPKLWITQTPNFVVGYRGGRGGGYFDRIDEQDVREDISEWEEANEGCTLRFQALLNRLKGLAMEQEGRMVEVEKQEDQDTIRVWKIDEADALPEELYKKWKNG